MTAPDHATESGVKTKSFEQMTTCTDVQKTQLQHYDTGPFICRPMRNKAMVNVVSFVMSKTKQNQRNTIYFLLARTSA